MSDTTVQVDDQVIDAIADKVKSSMPEIKVPSADEIAEKVLEKSEKTIKKNVTETSDKKTVDVVEAYDKLPHEVKFAKAFAAERVGNRDEVVRYNKWSVKSWAEKANYQNVTTEADGGALVPDPEFIAEVDRLTEEYGTVARLAQIRATDRDSVTILSGTNEISFTKTNEATAQNATKLTYDASTVSLDKYIATLIMTSELVEDSAINVFQDATNEIGRARAKLLDELVFNDATYGLLSAGVGDAYKTQTVGTALSDFSFDDAMNAQYQVVSSARRNGRFFMHPTVWNTLRQTKTGDGTNASASYYAGSPLNAPVPTIDGYPVELVDVLPDSGDITANEAFAVFGDMGRIMVHIKRQLRLDTFDSGVVKDAGGSDYNLITQDSFALRATIRLVPQTRFEGAFCIIGTGTVS
jgi:HK97 family phage major capsid protein